MRTMFLFDDNIPNHLFERQRIMVSKKSSSQRWLFHSNEHQEQAIVTLDWNNLYLRS